MRYTVWYQVESFVRARFTDQGIDPQALDRSHVDLGVFEAPDLDTLYLDLNLHRDSASGRTMMRLCLDGVAPYQSMSVGDVAVDETGRAWVCAPMGWRELHDA